MADVRKGILDLKELKKDLYKFDCFAVLLGADSSIFRFIPKPNSGQPSGSQIMEWDKTRRNRREFVVKNNIKKFKTILILKDK